MPDTVKDILGPPPPDVATWKADPAGFIQQYVGAPIRITSGYRSQEHNLAVGGVPDSAHTRGEAFDFVPKGMSMAEAAEALEQSFNAAGVKYDLIYNEGSHVHVSFDPRYRHMVMGALAAPRKKLSVEGVLGPKPEAGASPTSPPPAPAPKPAVKPEAQESDVQALAEIAGDIAHGLSDWWNRPTTLPKTGGLLPNIGRATAQRFHGAAEGLRQDIRGADPEAAAQQRRLAYEREHGPAALAHLSRDQRLRLGLETPDAASEGLRVPGEAIGAVVSPAGGAVEAITRKPALGDIAEMVVPIPGLKRLGGARAAEAGVGAERAEEVVARGERAATPSAATPHPAPVTDILGEPPLHPAARAIPAEEVGRDREIVSSASRAADGDAPAPGSPEHAGPVVGGEANPAERVDNAIHRLGGHATADKLEAQLFLKGLPEAVTDPKVQEELSDAIEQQIIDPNFVIPDHLQPAYQAFASWRAELLAITNRLRATKDPDVTPFLPDTGHTPRRVQGHAPIYDAVNDPQAEVKDPILGKRSLSTDSSSQHARTAGWVATDADGNSYFLRDAPVEGDTDPTGRPFTHVRQATMNEIEANTDIRYYKNPLVNTVDEVLRLRRVERNIQILEEIKQNLKDEGLAHQDEWHYQNEDGEWVRARANTPRPEGFVTLDHIPQLKGWSFDPRVAEVMQDYYPDREEPIDTILGKINRMMIGSLFITPVPHALNVWAHWTVGRGWDWMPQHFGRLMKTGTQAMWEVWSKGPKYRQMLREGSGLLYGDTQVRNFHQLMLEKAGYEITSDPETWAQFAKAFSLHDFGIKSARDFVRLLYRASSKSMWLANDVFMMQRVLELEEKGAAIRAAIKDAERDIPNYRIPSRVFGSRAWAQIIKSRQWLLFGRYKYGQWNALANMFKDLAKGGGIENPAARQEAFGKFMVGAIMMAGAFPAADALLEAVTDNKDARVRRPGPFAILDAIYQRATGEKDLATMISSMVSPAPIPDTAIHVLNNRNFFGQKIIDEQASMLGWAAQTGEFLSGPLYPLALLEEAAKPGGAALAFGRMFGLDMPPEGTRERRKGYTAKDKAAAARREAKDPIEQTLRKAGDVLSGRKPEAPPPAEKPPPSVASVLGPPPKKPEPDEAGQPHVPWPLSQ